ncbi:MAG: FAD-linked oxidase C-terminal domain-containing protein [Candidatus Carbobacillus sp.]|nr:FAD-linked oxidase C-terminal domain-containing protein [Candidatus Carbobacillus sp.]
MQSIEPLKEEMYVAPHVLRELQSMVGASWVLTQKEALQAYDSDGLTMTRSMPRLVVLPETTEEVASIVRLLHRERIPYLPRGAGTGLSGGVVPLRHEVVISLARMKKLLFVDPVNRLAVVQPGFVNLRLTRAVASEGLYFAPDPSSQYTCTIGGNVGENAGGAHCLKYGVTVNHVVGMTVVLPDGEIVTIGGGVDTPGYDLLALLTGAEGTLGIVTELIVRLLPVPEAHQTALAYFDTVEAASQTVSEIIGSGIVPAALEMMDRIAIEGVEKGTKPVGHPSDVAAVLLIEVDGMKASLDGQMEKIVAIAKKHGVRSIQLARDEAERKRWWDNRKTAFAAMGAISPNYVVQDGVIPISRLPEVLQKIARISETYGLRIANVFHAGDGNLHPLILYDASHPGEEARAHEAGLMALQACTDVGGSITGEHGVGLEKREAMCFMFDEPVLALGRAVREAFDREGLINAEKIYPTPGRCGEVVQAHWVHRS